MPEAKSKRTQSGAGFCEPPHCSRWIKGCSKENCNDPLSVIIPPAHLTDPVSLLCWAPASSYHRVRTSFLGDSRGYLKNSFTHIIGEPSDKEWTAQDHAYGQLETVQTHTFSYASTVGWKELRNENQADIALNSASPTCCLYDVRK